MGAQRRKQPAGARHDDCEHMRGYARRVSAKGPPFVSAAIGGPDGNIKPGTLRISVETAGPDRDAEGSDRLITRMAVALSSRGRMLEPTSAMRLTARARQSRRAPYPGTGRNRCRGDVFPDAFKEWGKGGTLQLGRKGFRAWERAPRPICDGHSRKSFSSRALESAATRPVARSYPSVMRGLSPTRSASNGCTRRFSPSAPQE